MARNQSTEETAELEAAAADGEGEVEDDAPDGIVTVSAGTTNEAGEKISVTLTFNAGATLDEAVEMYGKDLVYERWIRQVQRDFGNAIRSALAGGKSPEQTTEFLKDWRPDTIRRARRAPVASIEDQFNAMTPEQQQALIEKLMARAGAATEPTE